MTAKVRGRKKNTVREHGCGMGVPPTAHRCLPTDRNPWGKEKQWSCQKDFWLVTPAKVNRLRSPCLSCLQNRTVVGAMKRQMWGLGDLMNPSTQVETYITQACLTAQTQTTVLLIKSGSLMQHCFDWTAQTLFPKPCHVTATQIPHTEIKMIAYILYPYTCVMTARQMMALLEIYGNLCPANPWVYEESELYMGWK